MKYDDAIRMSVTITQPCYEYLKDLAHAEHRSISAQIRALVDAEMLRRPDLPAAPRHRQTSQ